MLSIMRWISLIFSGGSLEDMSSGRGVWAALPNCLGVGAYGQCWGRVGMQCLYFMSNFIMYSGIDMSKSPRLIIPKQLDTAIKVPCPILGEIMAQGAPQQLATNSMAPRGAILLVRFELIASRSLF